MPYFHHGKECETPSGVVLVEGIPEWEARQQKLLEEGVLIDIGVIILRGDETKEDLIHLGVFTEDAYKESVFDTTIRMILWGARKNEAGNWVLDDGRSVWFYHEWDWRQPLGGYNKAALSRIVCSVDP